MSQTTLSVRMDEDLKRGAGKMVSKSERTMAYVIMVLLTGMIIGIVAMFGFMY